MGKPLSHISRFLNMGTHFGMVHMFSLSLLLLLPLLLSLLLILLSLLSLLLLLFFFLFPLLLFLLLLYSLLPLLLLLLLLQTLHMSCKICLELFYILKCRHLGFCEAEGAGRGGLTV